ncbi:hypothetical protein Gasu2_49640 [Galdieria sulphuraria]|nr:hypothetical protein Gasu2_49640 [Galdieria sulphuraria]
MTCVYTIRLKALSVLYSIFNLQTATFRYLYETPKSHPTIYILYWSLIVTGRTHFLDQTTRVLLESK